jgi:oligosaccharide reducing-end xylanase
VRQCFTRDLWSRPVPTGNDRYYDGLLYLLGLLAVTGNFCAYYPPSGHGEIGASSAA